MKKRTCSGPHDSTESTRDNEGRGAGKHFGVWAWINAAAVGAAAEEEDDPEALGGGDTP